MSVNAGVAAGFQGCHLIKFDGYVLRATSPAKLSRGSWPRGHRTALVSASPARPAAFPEWKAQRMDQSRFMP